MGTGTVSDMDGMMKQKYWIKDAIKRPGGLHKSLGIPRNKKIPSSKLDIKESDSPLVKRQKRLAQTLKRLRG